jgi:hypothetical protein
VPRGDYDSTEKCAVDIVRKAEIAKGWNPSELLSQSKQREEGCDILSRPPDGGVAHRIEVKGWGEPLRDGVEFRYPADVNAEQLDRAWSDPKWRLEIVGNMAAVRAGVGSPERLTLSGQEVVDRAEGWRYRVRLDGLTGRIGKS